MMKQVNMHEAKSSLSKLGELVHQGEEVVIAKAGRPYLDLIPHREKAGKRVPGKYAGLIKLADDFQETPEEVISAFEGS